MPKSLSTKNKSYITQLLDNYNALPWYKKLFYPSALSVALRQYNETPSYNTAVAVHNAYSTKTWFFQRWFFSSLISFSSSSLGAELEQIQEENSLRVLPTEMVQMEIGKYLSLKDKAHLARTSKYYHGLFQPELRAARLLLLVVRGQQDEAHAMLEQHPVLLLKPSDVTDYSGRTFKKITAYEYAYWAMDTHMRRMLESLMNDETKAQMLRLINEIEAKGLTYEQQGVLVMDEKHFDFTPLVTALESYVQRFHDRWNSERWQEMKAAWMEVGMAQRNMPMHVFNEYCRANSTHRDDGSRFNEATFNEENLPRNIGFLHPNPNSHVSFNSPLFIFSYPNRSIYSNLGIDFAFLNGGDICRSNRVPRSVIDNRRVAHDLLGIKKLNEIRSADLTRSRSKLLLKEDPGVSMRMRFTD